MIVYRVEDHLGEGPYGDFRDRFKQTLSEELRTSHALSSRHPGPYEDKLTRFLTQSPHAVFGFDSIDKAMMWFDGYWDDLHEAGFELKTFETTTYQLGSSGKQLVFIK
jgi:hypothetical protein